MSGRAPELHRPLPIDRVPPDGLDMTVSATAGECAALAGRLGIPAVASLSCRFRLRALPGAIVAASGELRARVTQTCVVTLDDFEADIRDRFELRFVPSGRERDDPDPESPDEIGYQGAAIDLGEAAAEQLALALDPYPRKAGAALPEGADQSGPHPFAGLASRRPQ